MDYPKDFSKEAQAAVEAEKIKAVKDFNKAKREIQNRYDTATEVRSLLAHCVMRVFRVFAHEACELGRLGVWTAARIDKEAHAYLATIAKDLWYDHGYDITQLRLERITNDIDGSLLSSVERNFKRSPEWADYEEERLEVANTQSLRPHQSSNADKAESEISSIKHPFSNRAAWLRERLREREWNPNSPSQFGGPDHKTIKRILEGLPVQDGTIDKVLLALNKIDKWGKLGPKQVPSD